MLSYETQYVYKITTWLYNVPDEKGDNAVGQQKGNTKQRGARAGRMQKFPLSLHLCVVENEKTLISSRTIALLISLRCVWSAGVS